MATVTTPEANLASTAAKSTRPPSDQLVTMRGIDWQGYSAILELKGERRSPRVVFLDGDVSFMSPSPTREFLNNRLHDLIRAVLEGLEIPHLPLGSTTFRQEQEQGGVEADQSYYLANRRYVRGKKKIDLSIDPPPDLAVEVVVTHRAKRALEVYRRLGVPEVWICTEEELVFLIRGQDGVLAPSTSSTAMPCITATEVHSWLRKEDDDDEGAWGEISDDGSPRSLHLDAVTGRDERKNPARRG
ncbi:Uma2 family endonuclease [Aquisphaera insulae]|uniref:Uma2 family endonuclease n=1 Tax=Aquisphaera insulae TaxID=2712864 RepID=UPI0013EAC8FB|nr:Uma2 family endonuclease [Aquisphaera insulae]